MTATTPDTRMPLRERLLDRLDEVGDALHLPVTGGRVPGTIAVALLAGLASLAASSYFVSNHLNLGYEMVKMGMEVGLTGAIEQIDALLAEAA